MAARILIVEDSPLVTDAFRILFKESGYDVDVAATVAEGIERGAANTFDLMLLDLSLPDGSGLEVLEALRERGVPPRATLAMTGLPSVFNSEMSAAYALYPRFGKPMELMEPPGNP